MLPCPFDHFVEPSPPRIRHDNGRVFVECPSCQGRGPWSAAKGKGKAEDIERAERNAVDLWNARAKG